MPDKVQFSSLSRRCLSCLLSISTLIFSTAVGLNLTPPLGWRSFRMLYRLEPAQSFVNKCVIDSCWDKLQVNSVLAALDRPSFVFKDTCRAAKSETLAAPLDALCTRTSCALSVSVCTAISSVQRPCRRRPAWTHLAAPENSLRLWVLWGMLSLCPYVHLMDFYALFHAARKHSLNVDSLTVGWWVRLVIV